MHDNPENRPVNCETGEPMNDEEWAEFREMVQSGMIQMAPEVTADLKEHGLTEDEIFSFLHDCTGLKH